MFIFRTKNLDHQFYENMVRRILYEFLTSKEMREVSRGEVRLWYVKCIEPFNHSSKIETIPIFLMKWVVRFLLWIGIKALYEDQIPRLLSEKESDISESINYLNYSPRKLEDVLQEYLDITPRSLS